ncbi:MAG TPA: hypothetical protein VHD87_13740 [Acidimicrobiales bacterium]|nr:hypothetical protein [Acidimicrobiales bacterium]
MSDPQANAEQLDEDELPEDLIPDKFIEPEEWDAGAGADTAADHQDSLSDEDDIGQERESSLNAEDAAMHVERGISEGDE